MAIYDDDYDLVLVAVLEVDDTVFGKYLDEFPDANFRREVLRLLNDWDGKNRTSGSFMSWEDVFMLASFTHLNVYYMDIADMTGLNYFSGLQWLDCGDNQLTSLDVSNNTMLDLLYCDGNQLTSLDISNNYVLRIIWCYNNLLPALDISKNAVLMYLDCRYNYMKSPDDVFGWREIGLVLYENFYFYPQKDMPDPYDFTVYLSPAQTALSAGDTLLVDVMLTGDINYTQVLAELTYDTELLEFTGRANLSGFAGNISEVAPNIISLRSVPSLNMVAGAPCSPDVRIVTLQFTVKDNFAGESIDTVLAFASAAVSPTASALGATTAPGQPVSIAIYKQ
jgi:hypothetical protein